MPHTVFGSYFYTKKHSHALVMFGTNILKCICCYLKFKFNWVSSFSFSSLLPFLLCSLPSS